MSEILTPTQALLLFGVLALHGECAQAELMPAVEKTDREALEAAKLIAVKKIGRALFLSLTDRGWDWAGANLSAALPPPHQALHDLLARLAEHLAKKGDSLATFIGSKPEQQVGRKTKTSKPKVSAKSAITPKKPKVAPKLKATKSKPKASAKGKKPAANKKNLKPKAPTPAALRKRIEAAYLSITGGRRNESVRLAHLRSEMHEFDRAMVDAALGRILKGDKKASLLRHDDPSQLDQADHAAAFSPAGEPFHVIWIAS